MILTPRLACMAALGAAKCSMPAADIGTDRQAAVSLLLDGHIALRLSARISVRNAGMQTQCEKEHNASLSLRLAPPGLGYVLVEECDTTVTIAGMVARPSQDFDCRTVNKATTCCCSNR